MKINCIIIDDEPIARAGIENYISRVPFLELCGSFDNPMESVAVLEKNNTGLIFLDIEMPVISGLDFLSSLSNPPLTIIITAYPNYALKGYELNVFDYLLKPVPFDRFLKACNKVKDLYELKNQSADAGDQYFFIKCDQSYEKIFVKDILYAEALQNYLAIHTTQGKYITHMTMKYLEDTLPASHFLRVHRSYLVAIPHIDSIEGSSLRIGEHQLPVSRDNKNEILDKILKNKLLKG